METRSVSTSSLVVLYRRQKTNKPTRSFVYLTVSRDQDDFVDTILNIGGLHL